MISAAFFYEESRIRGFTVEGHAASVPQGDHDLVCASVSAVTQSALLGLDASIGSKFRWQIRDDGYLECFLSEGLLPEEAIKAEAIMQTVKLGLASMEKKYGQYLKLSKRRWTECCSK